MFYELLCNGEIYNGKGLKYDEKQAIIKFTYKNNNKIIFNPDYYKVNKTIENLNNRNIDIKYKFDNQKSSTIAFEFMKNEFGGIPYSTMNKDGDYIFHSEYIKNCQFNGFISEPQGKNLHAYDYNKHYTSLLMGLDCVFGWPVYTVFDEVKPYDGVIEADFIM